MPLASMILSAAGVIGPLAASAMILVLTAAALSAWMEFSSAAGTRMSHSRASNSADEIASAPAKPATRPVFSLWASSAGTSNPLWL